MDWMVHKRSERKANELAHAFCKDRDGVVNFDRRNMSA